MTDIRKMIENYLDNVDDSYIIDLHNNTLGGDTIVTRDDFDDHFSYIIDLHNDGTGYLELIDRLDGSFDASDDYFMDSYVIMSSRTLDDFIVFEMVIDYLKDTLEMADDRSDMPEGFEKLFDEYVNLAKPKHTEDEIRARLNEMVMDLPDSMVIHMASYKMDKFEIPFYEMSRFAEVCDSMNYGIPKVIGMLANSMGWFEFKDLYFTINDDNQFQSYSICSLKNEIWQGLCDNEYEEEWLNDNGYGDFAKVRNGYWE